MLSNLIRSLSALIIGVLLIMHNESTMPFLVRIVGLAFLLPALVSAVSMYVTNKGLSSVSVFLILLIDIGSMAFGLWLLLSPNTFLELFVSFLAVVLLCFALFQVYMVVSATQGVLLRWGLLVVPLLLAVAAILILANPFETVSLASIILGVAAVVSSISDIVICLLVRRKVSRSLQKRSVTDKLVE